MAHLRLSSRTRRRNLFAPHRLQNVAHSVTNEGWFFDAVYARSMAAIKCATGRTRASPLIRCLPLLGLGNEPDRCLRIVATLEAARSSDSVRSGDKDPRATGEARSGCCVSSLLTELDRDAVLVDASDLFSRSFQSVGCGVALCIFACDVLVPLLNERSTELRKLRNDLYRCRNSPSTPLLVLGICVCICSGSCVSSHRSNICTSSSAGDSKRCGQGTRWNARSLRHPR